jgi:cell division septum initiation protein DivIVA
MNMTAATKKAAPAIAPSETPNIMDKAVCLVLRIHSIGNHRKVSSSSVEVDADRDLINVQKTLIDADELRAIQSLDGETRRELYNLCLPSMFREGVYLTPIELIERVEDKLQKYAKQREVLLDKLIAVYPQRLKEAEERLRTLFNPADYPSASRLRGQFTVDWQYVQFGTPTKLKSISSEMFQREREKAEAKWAEATVEVQQVLRAAMAELVNHMADRLSGKEDGKKKVFRNTLVSNMKEFLDTFGARNIADDKALAALVEKAKSLVDGVDPDTLRKNDGLRDSVQAGFAEIKKSLDTMIVERPKRAFSLEDE